VKEGGSHSSLIAPSVSLEICTGRALLMIKYFVIYVGSSLYDSLELN
jgi:hypothetical protein